MAHPSHFRLRNSVAAGLLVAAFAAGATSQAWAATVTGPGVVTLPGAVVSGIVEAGVLGSIEDDTTDTGTVTYGTQNITLTAAGSTPIDVAAPISCRCGVYTVGWLNSTSIVAGSVNVSLLPSPSIRATASVVVPAAYPASGNVQVSAEIDYYFEIVDSSNPSENLPVPIAVSAAGGFAYSSDTPGFEYGGGYVNSSFYVSGVLHDYINGDATAGYLAPGPTSWSDSGVYTMYTNELYTVSLVAGFNGGVAGGDGGGSRTMSAYVDPTFALGAGVDPSQYSLVFSSGIGNASVGTVPEPSTWALMLLGFAGLGFAARKSIAAVFVA